MSAHNAAMKMALGFGFFDRLQQQSIGHPVSVQDLVNASKAPEELASRIMRHLAAWDIVEQVDANGYAAPTMSNAWLDPQVSSGIDF